MSKKSFKNRLNNIARDFRYTSIKYHPSASEFFDEMISELQLDIDEIFKTSNNCNLKTLFRYIVKFKDDHASFGNIFKESEFYNFTAQLTQLENDIIDSIPNILRKKCNCK